MKTLGYIIVLLVLASSGNAVSAQEKADTVKFTIDNCVSTYAPEKAKRVKNGSEFWFVDKTFLDGRTIKLRTVAPDSASHEPHSHDADEFFFVLEGTAEFFLNGQRKTVGPNTSLYCPPKSLHGIRNVGKTELKYLVIKKY